MERNTMKYKVKQYLMFAGVSTVLFCAVVIVPFIYGLYLTFTSWDGVSKEKPFVGLANYISTFQDAAYWQALGLEIRKAKKEVKARTEKMRDTEYFWGMGYITVILFVIIQNGAFQNDFMDFFRTPFMWYFQFCEWLAHPTYDNGFNQKIAYTCGEAWVIRILAIVAVLLIVVIIMAIIMEIIKKYKKMWDKISQMFLIGSLSGIAVLGDVIREYLPVNLILTFGFINVGIMLLKIYFQKKFEEKSLYADNHYD